MPIKNKDGSTYTLRGPNPLMKNQERWDKAKIVFHNMKWGGTTLADDTVVDTFKTDLIIPVNPEPTPEPEPEPEVLPDPPPPVAEKPRETETISVPKVTFKCQPATLRERKDPLYGDVTKTIQYGEPFSFEGIVVKNEYLSFQFWTTVSQITEGAIVFPQNQDRRWWRVMQKAPKTGGWLYDCVISDKQFSFASEPTR